MALCEVFPPSSVTIPVTFFGLIPAVMEGVRSFATSILPSGREAISTESTPSNTLCIRVLISRISVARCCISSSSIPANTLAYMVHTISTANSLQMFSPLMVFSISPVSAGSIKSIKCPCRISACSSVKSRPDEPIALFSPLVISISLIPNLSYKSLQFTRETITPIDPVQQLRFA